MEPLDNYMVIARSLLTSDLLELQEAVAAEITRRRRMKPWYGIRVWSTGEWLTRDLNPTKDFTKAMRRRNVKTLQGWLCSSWLKSNYPPSELEIVQLPG